MTPQEKEIALYGICFMFFCLVATFSYITYVLSKNVNEVLRKKE
jgi:hypothetical protein